MPIRFDKGGGGSNNSGGSGGGNNKGAIAILLLIVFFVFRKPKIAIPILIIGGILLWMGGFFDDVANQNNSNNNSNQPFGIGASIDEEKYDKTMVYEPLANSSSKNQIPASASLLKYAPTRRNQGQQGSCVGWASAYAARTILEAYTTGKSPNTVAFSPSFLYNQIAIPGCQGSYTGEALEKMKRDGLVFFDKFGYDENNCTRKPSSSLLAEGRNYRIRGYNRLSKGGRNYDVDINALKQNIAQGAPVVIAMKVPESFYYVNSDFWSPKSSERRNIDGLGGHAMCAIGYDDNKKGGAIQVMNSWGRNWGNDGVFWITYDDFSTFVREAYGLFPNPRRQASNDNEFEVEFGMVNANNGRNIPLSQKRGNLFQTRSPIKVGDRFKIEVSNSIECFVYVFGQETDGSSYILFPYLEKGERTSKYSPFCGIVGTRHFPSGSDALKADNIGNKDFMAVVVSKEELDYQDLNSRINRASGNDYLTKLNTALGAMQLNNPNFKAGTSTVAFKGKSSGTQKVVGVVIEIDKQ